MKPERLLPEYPVYIPSRDRYQTNRALTARCLTRDRVPFTLVVEEDQRELYAEQFPEASILVLPERGKGLFQARNWIKDHSTAAGHARHWQLDDNIRCFYRRVQAIRVPCEAGIALRAAEMFTDRYDNIAISGLNYKMFVFEHVRAAPFYRNAHVYSCSLINNAIPHRWRLLYNDDTDMCLQVLTDGWCTVLFNAFLCDKIATMRVPGGNTQQLYQGDGRLKMARSLERVWPGVVRTIRRFSRPQHVINWAKFDTPLHPRAGADLAALSMAEGDMRMRRVKDVIKSPIISKMATDRGA